MKAKIQIIGDYDKESKTYGVGLIAEESEVDQSPLKEGDEVVIGLVAENHDGSDEVSPALDNSASELVLLRKRIAEMENGLRQIAIWSQMDQDDHDVCALQWRGCVAIAHELLATKSPLTSECRQKSQKDVAWCVHNGDTPPSEKGTEWCVAKVGIAVACKPVASAADLPPTFDDHDPTSFNVFGTSPAAVARCVAEKIQQSFDIAFERDEHLGN